MKGFFIKACRATSVALWFTFFSVEASAEAFETKVTQIFTNPTLFGGCGAYIENAIQLDACSNKPRFISFDCRGDTGIFSKSYAQTMYTSAQLALVTQYKVYIEVLGDVKDGVCITRRLSVLHPDRTN